MTDQITGCMRHGSEKWVKVDGGGYCSGCYKFMQQLVENNWLVSYLVKHREQMIKSRFGETPMFQARGEKVTDVHAEFYENWRAIRERLEASGYSVRDSQPGEMSLFHDERPYPIEVYRDHKLVGKSSDPLAIAAIERLFPIEDYEEMT